MTKDGSGIPPELVGPGPAVLSWIGNRESSIVRNLWRISVDAKGIDSSAFHSGSTIIAANHRSLLDTVVLRYVLPPSIRAKTATVGARDFFAPGVSDRGVRWLMRSVLCWYIVGTYRVCLIGRGDDMGDGVGRITALLTNGWHVILFPEGTRSRDGELGRFRSGVAHLARCSSARVLPVWLGGTDSLMPVGARWLHRGTITVRGGEPMTVRPDETNSAFLDRLRASIVGLRPSGALASNQPEH
jgi:1-acyl-sn-glycerol-3-phosphate acyltransferase